MPLESSLEPITNNADPLPEDEKKVVSPFTLYNNFWGQNEAGLQLKL